MYILREIDVHGEFHGYYVTKSDMKYEKHQFLGKPVTVGREFLLELPQIQQASGEQFAHENIDQWATTPLAYSPKLLSNYPHKLFLDYTPG